MMISDEPYGLSFKVQKSLLIVVCVRGLKMLTTHPIFSLVLYLAGVWLSSHPMGPSPPVKMPFQ